MKSVALEYSEIIDADPEILVMIPCGFYISDIFEHLRSTVFPEALAKTSAYRAGEIYAMDATSYFSRPGPRVVEGAEILAQVIHPEEFGVPLKDQAVRIDPKLIRLEKASGA